MKSSYTITITEADLANAKSYGNVFDCLIATAAKRIFPEVDEVICGERFLYLDENDFQFTEHMNREAVKASGETYLSEVVGLEIKITKIS